MDNNNKIEIEWSRYLVWPVGFYALYSLYMGYNTSVFWLVITLILLVIEIKTVHSDYKL